MSTEANDDSFREAAVRSGLLTRQTADDLQRSAAERGVSFVEATVQAGALTAPQLEIIETLRKPGEVAPGYEIVSLLGEGGMGVVYRAKQLAFDRIIALKLVRVAAANPSGLARFEQEARTIGRLVHPHIVTAFDFGQHAGRFYLALELVDGRDAEQYVEHHTPLTETVVWHLIRQAASGLAYAAETGVIHRDIKPANLLLVTPPQGFPLPTGVPLVKIADFGLALLQDSVDERTRLTMEHTTVGSPLYMAPEQLSGSRVDLRADIYALGATAYHLLTGQPPFEGLTLAQTYAQKLHGEPQPLRELRPDLSTQTVDLVEWLMRRNADQRAGDYAAVLSAIDAVLPAASRPTPLALAETQPVLRTHAVTTTVKTPGNRRRGFVIAAIAVWVLITAGVTGYFLFVPKTLSPGPRDWTPTGWGVNCFNGRDLDGWQTASGNWIPGEDDGEGGRVLAGSGAIVYPIIKLVDGKPQPVAGFRLLALASRQQTAAIELQFGFDNTGSLTKAKRSVLRMTADKLQVGTRSTEAGPLTTVLSESPSSIPEATFVEWKLERQAHEWLVSVDGQLVATIANVTDGRPVFVLAAERPPGQTDARAWFSDVQLEELAPPRK